MKEIYELQVTEQFLTKKKVEIAEQESFEKALNCVFTMDAPSMKELLLQTIPEKVEKF